MERCGVQVQYRNQWPVRISWLKKTFFKKRFIFYSAGPTDGLAWSASTELFYSPRSLRRPLFFASDDCARANRQKKVRPPGWNVHAPRNRICIALGRSSRVRPPPSLCISNEGDGPMTN